MTLAATISKGISQVQSRPLESHASKLCKYTSRVHPVLTVTDPTKHLTEPRPILFISTMKIFVVAALALVSSSIAAPTTDKSLAVRESHILDAGARQGAFNAVSVDLEGLVDDPEAQKATTNVKRSKRGKKNKKKALTKTSMVSRKKGSKKSYKKHPKRLIKLKVTTTGFKSGQDIVDNLDSTLDQITDHTDNIGTFSTSYTVCASTDTI